MIVEQGGSEEQKGTDNYERANLARKSRAPEAFILGKSGTIFLAVILITAFPFKHYLFVTYVYILINRYKHKIQSDTTWKH